MTFIDGTIFQDRISKKYIPAWRLSQSSTFFFQEFPSDSWNTSLVTALFMQRHVLSDISDESRTVDWNILIFPQS